jgi:hypothetical protein
MQRQGHRSRQPTHAIGRPSASEQTFRLNQSAAPQQTCRLGQSAAPQQTRRGRRTATAQLHAQFHAWCRNASATIRWTGFSRAAAPFRRDASAAIGRALRGL